MGDLHRYKGREDFDKAFKKHFRRSYNKGNVTRASNILWHFYKDVNPGDKVLINSGERIFGIGTISGRYRFNDRLSYHHTKPIILDLQFWEPVNGRELGFPKRLVGKFCGRKPTVSRLGPNEWREIERKLRRLRNPFKGKADFEGIARAPITEQEVIVLFSKISALLRMKIEAVGSRFPDALIRTKCRGKWITQKCEFEKNSLDFLSHGHDGKGCDMIICWKHDWKRKPRHIRVVELRRELQKLI